MSNRVKFRLAVIGLLVFELIANAALYFFDDGTLDPAWKLLPEAANWYTYYESNLAATIIVALLLIVAIIASIVGVLLFRNWGRWLYLASSLLVLLVSIVNGAAIYYAWEMALWDAVNLINGAIIMAMFLPPISDEFNK